MFKLMVLLEEVINNYILFNRNINIPNKDGTSGGCNLDLKPSLVNSKHSRLEELHNITCQRSRASTFTELQHLSDCRSLK